MLCQRCKQKNATTYYTQNINGEKKEIALCDDCAKELSGGFHFFDPFSFSLDNFFSQLLTPHTKTAGTHLRLQSRITELESKLRQAIGEQRFEEAAKLRDEIASLKEQVEHHD